MNMNETDLFNFEEHEARAEASREALAEAEHVEAEASAAAEAKAERVESLEADMGTGSVTPAALTKARVELEIAEAQATYARNLRRAAEQTVAELNDDHETADAIAPIVRRLVHRTAHVLAIPAGLPQRPTLSDLRPVLAIVQTTPSLRDEFGWLSTEAQQPIAVETYFVSGLHVAPTREKLCAALYASQSVDLVEQHDYQVREAEETYTTDSGEEITKRTT